MTTERPDNSVPRPPGQLRRRAAEILGVDLAASAAERRKAYLRGIRDHPPDRDAQAFETIRDAYATLEDPKLARHALLAGDLDPGAPLERFLDDTRNERRFVGPGPWLTALASSKARPR